MRVNQLSLLILLLLLSSQVIAQDEPAEVTETPVPPITITIWWPDTFARVNDTEINPLLIEQANAFLEDNPNILFDHRLKPVGQTGGIMSTLQSAGNVARGALPTLTLLRRQDLLPIIQLFTILRRFPFIYSRRFEYSPTIGASQ